MACMACMPILHCTALQTREEVRGNPFAYLRSITPYSHRPGMFSTLAPRGRTSLVPSSIATPAASAPATAAAPTTSRLHTAANVTAVRFLPRATIGVGFGRGGMVGSTGASGDILTCVTAEGTFDQVDTRITLRQILTPEQIEVIEAQKKREAEDANDGGIDGSGVDLVVDPAPITATLQLKNQGQISDIQCLSDRLFVAATSSGAVDMIEISSHDTSSFGGFHSNTSGRRANAPYSSPSSSSPSSTSLTHVHTFLPSSTGASAAALATSLTSSTPLLASCSEDGSFSLLAPFQRKSLRQVRAHPSALHAAVFSSTSILHTGGMGGHISAWDVRALGGGDSALSHSPARPCSLLTDTNAVSITSLAMHPTRAFNIAAGSSNGCVSIFDLRATSRPLCTIQAQRSYVTAINFLPWSPSTLVATSEDGSVCAFDFAPDSTFASDHQLTFSMSDAQSRMKPTKLYQHSAGINAIAVDRETKTIVAGADGHALILLKNTV